MNEQSESVANNASTDTAPSNLDTRLRRLLKGALYICITGIYVSIVSLMFFGSHWKDALLSIVLIAFSLVLRFLSEELYYLGKQLRSDSSNQKPTSARLQKCFYRITVLLIHVTSVGLLVQTFFVLDRLGFNVLQDPVNQVAVELAWFGIGSLIWLGSLLLGLLVNEVMFIWIRRVNAQISYRLASYGYREGDPFGLAGNEHGVQRREAEAVLEKNIATLSGMVEDGKISKKNFEKYRDKHRIEFVMKYGE